MSPLPVLVPGDRFPPVEHAWGPGSAAPGLLAAGGALDVDTLLSAYRQGIFPWFSRGQPILWWSPDPRMVLPASEFRLHRSLSKTLRGLLRTGRLELRINCDFERVIHHCAGAARRGQGGTWIVPQMIEAYVALHRAGHAHSFEAWIDGVLAGGLYAVAIGAMVYGESMFALQRDASKLALAGLVAWCLENKVDWIDCQQNTGHLASLGAREVTRAQLLAHLARACCQPALRWQFVPVYWNHISRESGRHLGT